ncbi:MAG: Jag N-terminal domain-containing protein [Clostridia bacterium]|nr:Jag N-terminal domain-containing protein [Clostridia bacterium]
MSNSIISEGKTTNEAIENGLKQLGVSKDRVDIKVLEEENKKSFFSILTPRVVKVELTIKEKAEKSSNYETKENVEEKPRREYSQNMEAIENSKNKVEEFLKSWIKKVDESLEYTIKIEDYTILVDINGTASGMMIGYRGDTLNAMQTILSSIANNGQNEKIKLILDIENYREKREKVLDELAQKVAKTVLKTGKSVTLEPMTPYERKIIHNSLQGFEKIENHSIGEGDNRRVVISKIK